MGSSYPKRVIHFTAVGSSSCGRRGMEAQMVVVWRDHGGLSGTQMDNPHPKIAVTPRVWVVTQVSGESQAAGATVIW